MKILIIDDHKLFAEGLKQVLVPLMDQIEIELASTVEEGFAIARESSPDLAILDLYMPDSQGIGSLKLFMHSFPLCPVVVISACDHGPTIQRVMEAGALGFVSKAAPVEEMHKALQLVLAGEVYCSVEPWKSGETEENDAPLAKPLEAALTQRYNLTPRQLHVLGLITRGLTNREIAQVLGCTEGTVKVHVSMVLKALGAKNRTEAVWIVERDMPKEG
ncbi:MAG: response regulator transcription factor [Cellvibrionaceae bacterium]